MSHAYPRASDRSEIKLPRSQYRLQQNAVRARTRGSIPRAPTAVRVNVSRTRRQPIRNEIRSGNATQRLVRMRPVSTAAPQRRNQNFPLIRSIEVQNQLVADQMEKSLLVPKSIPLVRVRGRRTGGMGAVNIPPRRFVELEYVTTFVGATGGAGTARSFLIPLRTNSAFSVDSGSGTFYHLTPGFSVLAAAYSQYRVLEYSGDVEFASDPLSAVNVPVNTFVIHTDSNMGAVAAGTAGLAIETMAASRPGQYTSKLIQEGSAGPSVCKHTFKRKIAEIYGMPMSDPGFKCLTNASPANLTYMNIGMSTTATQDATSTIVWVKLKMKVEFFDPIDTLQMYDDVFAANFDSTLMKARPCAGCQKLTLSEYNPCSCGQSAICTTCGFKHPCCDICRIEGCSKRLVTVPIVPPRLVSRKDSEKKLVLQSYPSPVTYLENRSDGVKSHVFPKRIEQS